MNWSDRQTDRPIQTHTFASHVDHCCYYRASFNEHCWKKQRIVSFDLILTGNQCFSAIFCFESIESTLAVHNISQKYKTVVIIYSSSRRDWIACTIVISQTFYKNVFICILVTSPFCVKKKSSFQAKCKWINKMIFRRWIVFNIWNTQ